MEFEEPADATAAINEHTPPAARPAASFTAFSASDWKRIEAVGPALRAVGQMMLAEGRAIAESRDTRPQIWAHTDINFYRDLCGQLELTVNVEKQADVAQSNKEKKNKQKKPSRKDMASEQLIKAEVVRIKELRGALPRWGSTRPEVFFVAFRLWIAKKKKDMSSLPDKLVSALNLRACLDHPLLEQDLHADVMNLAKHSSFQTMLILVSTDESILANPSFSNTRAGIRL